MCSRRVLRQASRFVCFFKGLIGALKVFFWDFIYVIGPPRNFKIYGFPALCGYLENSVFFLFGSIRG